MWFGAYLCKTPPTRASFSNCLTKRTRHLRRFSSTGATRELSSSLVVPAEEEEDDDDVSINIVVKPASDPQALLDDNSSALMKPKRRLSVSWRPDLAETTTISTYHNDEDEEEEGEEDDDSRTHEHSEGDEGEGEKQSFWRASLSSSLSTVHNLPAWLSSSLASHGNRSSQSASISSSQSFGYDHTSIHGNRKRKSRFGHSQTIYYDSLSQRRSLRGSMQRHGSFLNPTALFFHNHHDHHHHDPQFTRHDTWYRPVASPGSLWQRIVEYHHMTMTAAIAKVRRDVTVLLTQRARYLHEQQDCQQQHPDEWRFFLSLQAQIIYGSAGTAFVFRSLSPFVYTVVWVLGLQMAWVAFRWSLYIMDDTDMRRLLRFINYSFHLGVKEAEDFLDHRGAIQYAKASGVHLGTNTGVKVAKAFYNARLQHLKETHHTTGHFSFR